MAGNSNLLSAGGWRPRPTPPTSTATTTAAVHRPPVRARPPAPTTPARPSSTSRPAPVSCTPGCTSTRRRCRRPSARCACASTVPAAGLRLHRARRHRRRTIPKLSEGSPAAGRSGPALRQAVWDVTELRRAGGAGTYTVADIVHERAGAFLPVRVVGDRRRLRARSGGRPGRRRPDAGGAAALRPPRDLLARRVRRRAPTARSTCRSPASTVDAGRAGVRQELPHRRPRPAPRRREPALRRPAARQQRDARRRRPHRPA